MKLDTSPLRWDRSPVSLPGWRAETFEPQYGPSLYCVSSPRKGPDLLLLPGMNAAWYGYLPVLPALAERFTVTVVDLRGHGLSGRSQDARYRVADYVQDIGQLVASCFSSGVVLAGNSLGALVAAGVAAAEPTLVRGVVLEDGPFFITEAGRWGPHPFREAVFGEVAALLAQRDRLRQDLVQFQQAYAGRSFAFMPQGGMLTRIAFVYRFTKAIEPLLGMYAADEPARLEAALATLLHGGRVTWGELFPRAVVDDAATRYFHVAAGVPAAGARVDFSEGLDHQATLENVRCPTLLLEADREMVGMLSLADMDRMKNALGSGVIRHRHVVGAGHEIHQSHPEVYVNELTGLFAR